MGGATGHGLVTLRDLPDVASATLPDTYQRAKDALATCDHIDECKTWADKMAALASYAKQADDPTLHRLAVRIQARAMRRAGELLRQFENERAGAGRPPKLGAATDRQFQTRRSAADAAGMSERQELTAVRVANVPVDEFESALSRDDPPTVTALAERGTTKRPAAPGVADATALLGMLRALSLFCESHAPADVVVGLFAHEPAQVREHLRVIGLWVEDFTTAMEDRYGNDEQPIHRAASASRARRALR